MIERENIQREYNHTQTHTHTYQREKTNEKTKPHTHTHLTHTHIHTHTHTHTHITSHTHMNGSIIASFKRRFASFRPAISLKVMANHKKQQRKILLYGK